MGGKNRTMALLGLLVLFAMTMAMVRVSGIQTAYGFRLPEAPVAEPAANKAERPAKRSKAAPVNNGRLQTFFASSKQHTQVHAATLVELKDGCTSDTLPAKPADCGSGPIRAFWFSGSREGAADVTINSALFYPHLNGWGVETVVAGRASTQRALHRYIAKVGNPVVARAQDGKLWLFYVTVSLGGWAGSSITLMTSSDEGASWSAPKRLVTSPFINISTLVKSPPFQYADGSMGLPVYHEFVSKFAEILRLDADGNVIDKQRLAAGGEGTLQPVVLVRSEQEALALTRYSGNGEHRVVSIATADGGRHWGKPAPTALKNPNAALTALALHDGKILAVLNDSEHGRETLSLQLSEDGGTSWRELRRLEEMRPLRTKNPDERACLDLIGGLARSSDAKLKRADARVVVGYVDSAKARVMADGGCNFEFSYPYMIQARNGDVHLAYTWNRTFIKHLVLDRAWLQRRLQEKR